MSDRRRPTFDEALGAARRGSPWGFGWLYRRFQPALLRTLTVIAPHHAEDVAAEVWLEVAGTLPRFAGDERAFRRWLATMARHRVIDATRGAAPRSERHPGQRDAASFAAGVVEVLPPEQADVILLRVVEGLDVEQVARALGKPPGTVRALQHRALRRLAHQLEPGTLTA
jgi:RNA polymerase sigma-70 factor (ECF subfamily)